MELHEERRALAARAERYGDELARALLALLDGLSGLGPQDSRAAAAAALGAAARAICFRESARDRTTPLYPHDFGATPSRPRGPLLVEGRAGLLAPLEDLLRELIFAADVQEYVDARGNSAAYLRAATQLARAAPHLLESLDEGGAR